MARIDTPKPPMSKPKVNPYERVETFLSRLAYPAMVVVAYALYGSMLYWGISNDQYGTVTMVQEVTERKNEGLIIATLLGGLGMILLSGVSLFKASEAWRSASREWERGTEEDS